MLGKKKEVRRPNSGGLSQFGLLDVPGVENVDQFGNLDSMLGDEGDDDLEAELEALMAGTVSAKPGQAHQRPTLPTNLDAKVADCMKNISDDEHSGDEDDPDLLAELASLVPETSESSKEEKAVQLSTPPDPISHPKLSPSSGAPVPPPRTRSCERLSELSQRSGSPAQPVQNADVVTILERLEMYKLAEANAKSAGESSRARRFGRGVKTLNDMLKKVKAGHAVSEEDIPPPVATGAQKKPQLPADPGQPETSAAEETSTSFTSEKLSPSAYKDDSSVMHESSTHSVPSLPLRPPENLPPEMFSTTSSSSSQVDSTPASTDTQTVKLLTEYKDTFKKAAVAAKKAGNVEKALEYVKTVKQFEAVIAAAEQGQPVDLSEMPSPPPGFEETVSQASESAIAFPHHTASDPVPIKIDVVQHQRPTEKDSEALPLAEQQLLTDEQPAEAVHLDPSIFGAPPPPETVLEALEQRLVKYQSTEAAAKTEGNSSKARRMGRIVKQYQQAIKQHQAGKPVPYDELPTPPGFAPIPGSEPLDTDAPSKPSPTTVPTPAASVPMELGTTSAELPVSITKPLPPPPVKQKVNVRRLPMSTYEKQLAFLQERQKLLKQAALEAKRKGETNQAVEYLRQAKGFDPLIDASRMGLPVDMKTLPVPPQLKVSLDTDFEVVSQESCSSIEDRDEMYKKLENELISQIKMCVQTRDHFKSIGDVASTNRFEHLGMDSKKDLDALRYALKRGDTVPKFQYEMKSFSIVQCCTDLGDNDLELTIICGINYNVSNPKEVDTYVKYEFPFPSEDPPRDKTNVVKDTNNPEYNQTFMIPINRSSRSLQRAFKRHGIKCEVWAKGGWFKGDTLIGTVVVKLQPLETKCILHDSFSLMDGRKPAGGKLEIKVRIRNPIVTKQVEQNNKKWLVIGGV